MEIPGSAAFAAVRSRAARASRAPAVGLLAIAPLVLLGAVSATSPTAKNPVLDDGITSVAAVADTSESANATVIAAQRAPRPFRVAAASGVAALPATP